MFLIARGKTNWLFIIIVFVLSILITGGILFYIDRTTKETISLSNVPEINKDERLKILNQMFSNYKTVEKKEDQNILYYQEIGGIIKIYKSDIEGLNKKEITTFPATNEYQIYQKGTIILAIFFDNEGGKVNKAFLFDLSTAKKEEVPELIGLPWTNYYLSPLGDKVFFIEREGIWTFDFSKREKEQIKPSLDYGQIIMTYWSEDGKKIYFSTSASRGGFENAWSTNDTIYSVDVDSKEEKIVVDYSEICDEPFFIRTINENLFLAECGNNFSETKDIAFKIYDKRSKTSLDILTGNIFALQNVSIFPNIQKTIYYNRDRHSLMSLDLKTKNKTNLNITQNQDLYASDNGKYFIYLYLYPTGPIPSYGIYLLNLENNQTKNILENVHFINWID